MMKWAPFMLPGGIKRVPYPFYFTTKMGLKTKRGPLGEIDGKPAYPKTPRDLDSFGDDGLKE